jgi:hypothetical protein
MTQSNPSHDTDHDLLTHISNVLDTHAGPAHDLVRFLQQLLADRLTPREHDLMLTLEQRLIQVRGVHAMLGEWLERRRDAYPPDASQ